jgi:hypothetical protein
LFPGILRRRPARARAAAGRREDDGVSRPFWKFEELKSFRFATTHPEKGDNMRKILLATSAIALAFVFAGTASAQVPSANHYMCHKVKDLKTPAKFAAVTVTAVDQTQADSCTLKKAYLLCEPVVKNGSVIVDAALHYVCYKAKCGQKVSANYDTTDQFGPLRLQTKKPFLICNPASKAPA